MLKIDPKAPLRKKRLAKYAKAHKITIPNPPMFPLFIWQTPVVGASARELIRRVQRKNHNMKVTGQFDEATLSLLFPVPFDIEVTAQALAHGSTRSLGSIRYITLHDMEFSGPEPARSLGGIAAGSGYGASPHYGVDDHTICEYLRPEIVGWHCTSFNITTVGIEQAGFASWDHDTWMAHKPTLDRTAWLIARLSKKTGVPIVFRDAAHLRSHGVNPPKSLGGITTHWEHTKALCPGDHTDPGPNYPMSYVIQKALEYRG